MWNKKNKNVFNLRLNNFMDKNSNNKDDEKNKIVKELIDDIIMTI